MTRPESHLREGWNTPDVSADTRAGLLGDGSERKNRGRSAELSLNASPVVLLDLMGDDQLARAMTITLNARAMQSQTAGDYPTSSLPPLVARIDWGIDGSTFSAEMDMRQGVTFTISASSLRLQARVDELALVPIAAGAGRQAWPDLPCIVSASAGYYPSTCTATRTLYARAAPNEGVTIPVPSFARRVRVTNSTTTGGLVVAQIAAIFPAQTLISSSAPIDVEICNGAVALVCVNMSANEDGTIAAIFELDL